MSDTKFPVTSRDDVSPSKNSFPKKNIGPDWGAENEAMNKPNDPRKRHQPTSFNPSEDYGDCDD